MKTLLLFLPGIFLFAAQVLSQVPTVTSFSPTSGTIGSSVTIVGTNFSATPVNNIVYFGATRASVTAATTTQLTVTVPLGTSYQPISVNVGGLVGHASAPFIVTFANGVGIDANAFDAKVDLATATTDTRSVGTGDIDGDGKPDLIVANTGSNTVSVYRNTSSSGSISYAPRVNFTVGAGPASIAVGDLDGDGKLDLAVGNLNGASMSVLRNSSTVGAVAFAASVNSATGSGPISISIGELDGDGKPDIAVANYVSNSVSTFRNTSTIGAISFAAKIDLTTGSVPNSVSINDQDGDGKNDIIVPNYSSASFSVLRNTSTTGSLLFAAKLDVALPTGSQPQFIYVGDLDGDGKADLAVAVGVISIFRNISTPGSINYATKVDVSAGSLPITVGISDIDGDGIAELAVANLTSSAVSIIKNTSSPGTLTFPFRFSFATGSNPRSVAIADQDGDGKMDVTVANGTSGTISVLRNNIKISQSITFGSLSAKTFGDAPFALNATASSGLPVSYTSSNLSVATISGNTVTIVGAGSTTITASQPGDATYAPATSVPQLLTVNKANQTITFGALAPKTFGDAAFNLTATSSSSLAVSYTSGNPSVATISGNTLTIVGTGTTTITATQAGNSNFNPASDVPQTLTVNKANQTITFGVLAAKTFGDAPFALTATSSSGLAITYSSSNTAVATVSGNTATVVAAGSTLITASQPGNANYNPATDVLQALIINKANQTITFGALAAKTFGDAAFNLPATSSSGLPVNYTSSNTAVASVSGNTVTIIGVGTTTITTSQAGNANFNPATNVQQVLTVNKADQTITFATLASKTVGDAPFLLAGTASSGLPISYTSSNTSVATVSGNTVTVLALGTTTITATQNGDANFNPAADVQQTLAVKSNQTITFSPIADKTVGDPAFALSATATSSLPVTFSTTSNKITISGSQVTIVGAGRVIVTAAQAGNVSFNAAATVNQSFCIKPAKPSVTLSNTNTVSPTLNSSASAGNQWYRNGTAIAGATNTTLSVTQAGVYKVQVQVDDCISAFSDDQAIIVTAVEPTSADQLNIYPNPAQEELTIDLGGFMKSETVFVSTIDLLGRAMNQLTGEGGGQVKMDVRSFAPGHYVVQLKQGKTSVAKSFFKN